MSAMERISISKSVLRPSSRALLGGANIVTEEPRVSVSRVSIDCVTLMRVKHSIVHLPASLRQQGTGRCKVGVSSRPGQPWHADDHISAKSVRHGRRHHRIPTALDKYRLQCIYYIHYAIECAAGKSFFWERHTSWEELG
jgi:hypothetical protein